MYIMPSLTSTRNKESRAEYLATLRSKVQEMSSPKQGFQKEEDETVWKCEVDHAGNGMAIIRFLPCRADEAFPFVQMWSHGFHGPNGKWYIENCPSTISGVPSDVCPACAGNNELWNASKDKADPRKNLARDRKRKLGYTSNILVINDLKHPENNNKVFKFRYGKKIFEKIKDLLIPPAEFPNEVSCDAFDMLEGANFKLRVTKQDNYPNYDKSSFESPSPIGDDAVIARIESQLYPLNDLLAPKHFKSFEALKARYLLAVSPSDKVTETEKTQATENDDMPVAKPKTNRVAAAKVEKTVEPPLAESGDEDIDFFAKLAQKGA